MSERLIAVANGRLVGRIARDAGERLSLEYDAAWREAADAFPLSLSMPLASARHGHGGIEPWLWGLLPDNERVLARWARRFHVSARSAFALLSATGEDCPGAVQLVRPERAGRLLAAESQSGSVVWLTNAEVEARLRTLREDRTAWRLDEDVGQFSLAGAQAKTALLLDEGRWGVPHGATPTTHILKPPIPGFAGHCENEHLCMRLARSLGIPAARSRVARFGGETALVVERYDRVVAGGRLQRVHQEDLCQALGRSPTRRYESEGGPGGRDIAVAIRSLCRRPGEDLRTFVKAIALNWVIAGTDAHARNFSFLIGAGGRAALAPLYDLASALPYPGHYAPRLKLAMKIGGEARVGYVQVRHWGRFAADVGLPPDEVLSICESLAAKIPDRCVDIARDARAEGVVHPIVDTLVARVATAARACLDNLRR